MKVRCSNPKAPKYADYGGRGIRYDPRWESFENFLADMGERPEGMTLDRIDNGGNYTRDNCRWATRSEQNRNMRITPKVAYAGEEMAVADLAERLGVSADALKHRIKVGWPEQDWAKPSLRPANA